MTGQIQGTDGTFPDFLSCGPRNTRQVGDRGIPPLRKRPRKEGAPGSLVVNDPYHKPPSLIDDAKEKQHAEKQIFRDRKPAVHLAFEVIHGKSPAPIEETDLDGRLPLKTTLWCRPG